MKPIQDNINAPSFKGDQFKSGNNTSSSVDKPSTFSSILSSEMIAKQSTQKNQTKTEPKPLPHDGKSIAGKSGKDGTQTDSTKTDSDISEPLAIESNDDASQTSLSNLIQMIQRSLEIPTNLNLDIKDDAEITHDPASFLAAPLTLAPTNSAINQEFHAPAASDDSPKDLAVRNTIKQSGADSRSIPTEPMSTSASQVVATAGEQPGPKSGQNTVGENPFHGMEAETAINANSINRSNAAVATDNRPTLEIPQRIGTAQWDTAVGQKIILMSKGDISSATIEINPPELGPMTIKIKIENGETSASFLAEQPEVRKALEDSIPKLREVLSDAGITLGETTIGNNTDDDKKSSFSHGREQNNRSRTDPSTPGEIENAMEQQAALSISSALVDTFA